MEFLFPIEGSWCTPLPHYGGIHFPNRRGPDVRTPTGKSPRKIKKIKKLDQLNHQTNFARLTQFIRLVICGMWDHMHLYLPSHVPHNMYVLLTVTNRTKSPKTIIHPHQKSINVHPTNKLTSHPNQPNPLPLHKTKKKKQTTHRSNRSLFLDINFFSFKTLQRIVSGEIKQTIWNKREGDLIYLQ